MSSWFVQLLKRQDGDGTSAIRDGIKPAFDRDFLRVETTREQHLAFHNVKLRDDFINPQGEFRSQHGGDRPRVFPANDAKRRLLVEPAGGRTTAMLSRMRSF